METSPAEFANCQLMQQGAVWSMDGMCCMKAGCGIRSCSYSDRARVLWELFKVIESLVDKHENGVKARSFKLS